MTNAAVHDVEGTCLLDSDARSLKALGGSKPLNSEIDMDAPAWMPRMSMLSAYSCARWGERCWEFAIVLLLVAMSDNSLSYTAAYGLLEDVLQLVLGSVVGQYIDRTDRFQAASLMCVLQNMCVAASAACAALAISTRTGDAEAAEHSALQQLLAAATIILGSMGSVGSMGLKASLEADWPKAMCGEDTDALTHVNSVLRGIDMVCLLVAPIAASLMMQYWGVLPTVLFLLVWNLVGAFPEVILMKFAYQGTPSLRKPRAPATSDATPTSITKADAETDVDKPASRSLLDQVRHATHELCHGWKVYAQQKVLLAAIALAVLYCTVLSLGYLMTGYIKMRGMSESSISVFRGVGAVSGLLSTVVFPKLVPRIGLKGCGLLGIYWQLGWLLLGAGPSLLSHLGLFPSSLTQPLLYLLLVALAMSRFGLWLFDLAVGQLMQEEVEEAHMGSVNAVQNSMCSGLELLMFSTALAAPHTRQFPWLMFVSLCIVASAAALFTMYASKPEKQQGYKAVQMQDVDECTA